MIEFVRVPELQDLWDSLPEFEQKLIQMAKELSISLSDFPIDHISVRCHHIGTAERWREGLSQCAQLLSDNEINGRPIYIFELKLPIVVASQKIFVIELPFPKGKTYPQETWEHVEMVISVPPQQLENTASALLPKQLPDGYSQKISQPKGQLERLPNPTLAVTNGIITVKYHPFTLKEIIKSEN
ncbi:VOC family protein [Providencia burhodogranariea]|uniref:Metal-binding enzyme n=1 Tax=Providencia burhodogranariea DSM 19968 TaxID=1141662 RepID=K8WRS1_9GAMM|nr:VOC family protein [Providencia burhodogranariea]EKT62661.1 hypothetical protein OOA_06601 [Providencia burhodogranariea DSM 19968]